MSRFNYEESLEVFSKLDIKPKNGEFKAYNLDQDDDQFTLNSGEFLACIYNRRVKGDHRCLGGAKATNFLIDQIDIKHGDAVQLMMCPVEEWLTVAKEILNDFGN